MTIAGACPNHGFYKGSECPGCLKNPKKNFLFTKTIDPYWHEGLGEWVKSGTHLKKLMNKHGAVEVGTEDIRQPKHQGMNARDIKEIYHGKRA